MRAWGLLVLLVMLAVSVPGAQARAAGPSFDCAKASTEIEKTICGDPGLSELDAGMEATFRNALIGAGAGRDALLAEQRGWLRGRSKECPPAAGTRAMAGCLKSSYEQRLSALSKMSAVAQAAASPGGGLNCDMLAAKVKAAEARGDGGPSLTDIVSGSGLLKRVATSELTQESADRLYPWSKEDGVDGISPSMRWADLPTKPPVAALDQISGTLDCHRPVLLTAGPQGTLEEIEPRFEGGDEGGFCSASGEHIAFGHAGDVPVFFHESRSNGTRSLQLYELRGAMWQSSCLIKAGPDVK